MDDDQPIYFSTEANREKAEEPGTWQYFITKRNQRLGGVKGVHPDALPLANKDE